MIKQSQLILLLPVRFILNNVSYSVLRNSLNIKMLKVTGLDETRTPTVMHSMDFYLVTLGGNLYCDTAITNVAVWILQCPSNLPNLIRCC